MPKQNNLARLNPATLLVLGYLTYAMIGWILLSLPWVQSTGLSGIDTLFMSISAVSTTGLVTVDPGTDFNFFGQLILLILIQLGGIGYMTFGSFVILATGRKISRIRRKVSSSTFAIPEEFKITQFIRHVALFTFGCELVGAVVLYVAFLQAGVENAAWQAIFHSVSAFCTAGFSLFSNSFESFADNPLVVITICTLSYLGAIGFIVWVDFWNNYFGKKKYLGFTSKVILHITFWFSLFAIIMIFLTEPSIQGLEPWQRLLRALFQAMTATTTVGFNTVPIGSMGYSALMIILLLMVFGASPSGTGGGLKSTTLAALLGLIKSTLKGRDEVRFMKRTITSERLQLATASFAFYMLILFVAVLLLTLTNQQDFISLVFEAISAMGTVGLSMGITSDLTVLGKLVIILLMFIGRVGILSFGIAVSTHDECREEEEDNQLLV